MDALRRGASQTVSGLLLALPLLAEDSEIVLTDEPVSRPYLDMTTAVMARHALLGGRAHGYRLPGGQLYRPAPEHSEPDWSAAAFWLASMPRRSGGAGAGCTRAHGPPALLAGGRGDHALCKRTAGGDRHIRHAGSAAAAGAAGGSAALALSPVHPPPFCGARRNDRLAAVAGVLRALGVPVEEQPDGLTVTGTETLHGGNLDSCGDHRIAMLAGCAAMLADGP